MTFLLILLLIASCSAVCWTLTDMRLGTRDELAALAGGLIGVGIVVVIARTVAP